jgi:hypothetical protein
MDPGPFLIAARLLLGDTPGREYPETVRPLRLALLNAREAPMSDKLHLSPDDDFPEDLSVVSNQDLQVLDSQVQRQLDYEYVADGEPNPETEFRHHDLDDEFQERDER